MVSIRLMRHAISSIIAAAIVVSTSYCLFYNHQHLDTSLEKNPNKPKGGDDIPRVFKSNGPRDVDDYEEPEEELDYSSNTNEKADVETILWKSWNFNETAALQTRKEMFSNINSYKIITMTSDDAVSGQLQRFYHSKAIPVMNIPHGLRHLLPLKQLFHGDHYKTCSLVGNGGILLNSGCGRKIDENDFVIRCNFAELDGFTNDVGTKTNVLTFNPSILDVKFKTLRSPQEKQRFLNQLKAYGNYVLWIPVFSSPSLSLTTKSILDFFEKNAEQLKNVQLAFPGNILPDILDFWLTKGVDEERISTGLLMYMFASIVCREIHLFGFYPFRSLHGHPLPYHYDEKLFRTLNNSNFNSNFIKFHKLPDEFVYLKKMHDLGILRLQIGECAQ